MPNAPRPSEKLRVVGGLDNLKNKWGGGPAGADQA